MILSSLRARLLLVAAVALLPLLGFFLYTQRTIHALAEQEFQQGALRLADAASETHSDILRDTRVILDMAADRSAAADPGPGSCATLFEDVYEEHPAFTVFGLVRPDGMTVCLEPPGEPLDLSDRPYFQRAMRTGRLSVSEYHLGHITGRPVVTMARPVLDDEGRVVSVLAVGLDLRRIEPLDRRMLPPWASVLLFDSEGNTLYSSEGGAEAIGDPVPAYLVAAARSAPGDTVVMPPGDVEDQRAFAVVDLEPVDMEAELDAFVAVAFRPETLSGAIARASRPTLLGLLLAGAVLLLGIGGVVEFLVLRRLARMADAAERMSRGDLTARSEVEGSDEIGLLARTFDDMAESLEETRAVEAMRAQRRIHESEERFRLLAETIDEVFWIRDPEGDGLVYLSPAFEEVWGHPRDEFMEDLDAWARTVHPDDREVVREWVDGEGYPREGEIEYRIVRADGETRWIRNRTYTVEGPVETRYYLGVAQDVTEQKTLEDAVIQSSKLEAVGQLAGGVAHDFNNVLTAIQGHAQLLGEDLPDDHPGRTELKEIQTAADRAAGLTRQLLAFSRKQATQPVTVDLNELVEELVGMTRRLIGEDILLITDLSSRPAMVHADPNQLEQVFINLTVNARDAMPRGGTLTVETDVRTVTTPPPGISDPGMEPGAYVVLTVRDTGIGMDSGLQARIFEPFFTTKGPAKGTGLGLATVYGIVHQSGGFVRVESETGEGTTFTVYFPERRDGVDERGRESRDEDEAREPVDAATVLVVEDEEAVRMVVCKNLERLGYRTLAAASGEDALTLFREEAPDIDLLITDVVMPGIGGPELRQRLQALDPELPVIYMSGYPGYGGETRTLDPDTTFLQKPFTREVLARTVEEALKG